MIDNWIYIKLSWNQMLNPFLNQDKIQFRGYFSNVFIAVLVNHVVSFCLFILFMAFSKQEYWSGLPFPFPGILMLLNLGVGEDSWESLGLQGDQTSQCWKKSILNIHWKDWFWNSNTLATWCEELTHWKRPWCWERLKAGEGDNRGWDGWMAPPTQWTWVWASSWSWWRTGRPGVLQSMGSQRIRHD